MLCCQTFGLVLVVFGLLAAFLPNTKDFFGFDTLLHNYKLDLPESFSGSLLANRILSGTEHLYVNEIRGPESFAVWQGRVFTSLADGRIVEVLHNQLKTIAFIDPSSQGLEECGKAWISASGNCSRPLGLRFDSRGQLYTVDPYHGVYRIDIASGQYELVLDIQKHRLPDGSVAGFLDDLLLLEQSGGNLVIYLSLASTRWPLHDVFYTCGEYDQTGKLLSFDTRTGKVSVEADNLAFPNGLEWTDDKSAMLVNELNSRTIYKFHLKGANKGKLTKWAANLPGEPDNIKRSADRKRETYWVALFVGRNKHMPLLLDKVTNKAVLRRFAFRVQRAIGFLIQSVGHLSDCPFLISAGFEIKVGNPLNDFTAKHYGLVVELDAHGKIINSLHDPSGASSGFSEIHEIRQTETERHFLLGSFQSRYLGRLVVKKCQLAAGGGGDDHATVTSTTRKVSNEEGQTRSTGTSTLKPTSTTPKPANLDKKTKHVEL